MDIFTCPPEYASKRTLCPKQKVFSYWDHLNLLLGVDCLTGNWLSGICLARSFIFWSLFSYLSGTEEATSLPTVPFPVSLRESSSSSESWRATTLMAGVFLWRRRWVEWREGEEDTVISLSNLWIKDRHWEVPSIQNYSWGWRTHYKRYTILLKIYKNTLMYY